MLEISKCRAVRVDKGTSEYFQVEITLGFHRDTRGEDIYNLRKQVRHILDVAATALEVGRDNAAYESLQELAEMRLGLSITGNAGHAMRPAEARRMAREYWEEFFEDDDNIAEMNQRMGTRFRSPRSAARYVLQTDGEYHGLDVNDSIDDDKRVYVGHSWGMLHDEVRDMFPELVPVLPYHLNDMRPVDEGRAWGYEPIPFPIWATLLAFFREHCPETLASRYA